MRQFESALLMLGSPRAHSESNSYSLGSYLLGQLEKKGVKTSLVHVNRALRSDGAFAKLRDSLDRADLVVLSCPLYVDSLPASVIHVMEMLAGERKVQDVSRKRFLAIINCGFPESKHTEIALAICRRFAKEAGMKWEGGLGLGGGEALGGRPLEEVGGLARNVRNSLRLTAESLVKGDPVPESAKELISKPLIPSFLYRWIGHWGWKRQAKQYGVKKDLMARPFLQDH